MGRVARLFKHRLWDEADARRALPAAALERLRQRVAQSEARHTGEVRVCVEASLPLSYLWRDAPARERAIAMFGKLRVWDTEHNNGVLIYLLLAEHAIEVVADRGLKVDAARWQALVAHMSEAFQQKRYEEGLVAAVDEVTALLVERFPLAPGAQRGNELPDSPEVV